MKMTTNEALTKHTFISKVVLKNGDAELSKELKVKIMGIRIKLGKIRKQFDEDLQQCANELLTDEFKALQAIPEDQRTDEQKTQVQEMADSINAAHREYSIERGKDEVDVSNISLSDDEYFEIVGVFPADDVNINGQILTSADFLEILYSLFVE